VNDRSSFRLASVLAFGGQLLYIVAGVFHPDRVPANSHPAVFEEYANSAYWGAVHMGQFAGIAVVLAGLVVLAFALANKLDAPGWLGRFSVISAVVTIALAAVLQAVDGVALKAASDAWLAAPAAEQPARLAATEAVRWLEWAVRSYQRTMVGVTLLLLASQIVVSVRLPRPLGYVMALSGIAYVAQGMVVGAEGFSSNNTIPGLAALVLDLAWMIWLVVVAWQKPNVVRPVATARVAAS
jgi:hypothetical protein